jgi:GT2 family glycosyltransferase
MINSVAVLITCHNRKDKTIACLQSLFDSTNACNKDFDMDVFLTDDGSVDGTAEVIRRLFPIVNIFAGNGELFWSGGMRNSWNEALKVKSYDYYLLLNDDTVLYKNCFDQLFDVQDYSLIKYGKGGICIGSVRDHKTSEHTYGASNILNRWTLKTQDLFPDGTIKECDYGNGNIMFVHKDVTQLIGILHNKYIHAKADYDYCLRAHEKNLPVLVCSEYCGECVRDHYFPDLRKMSFRKRIALLYNPKGVELNGYMYFIWRFFPWRTPFVFCSLWLKTFFPSTIKIINRIMRR